MIDLNQVIIEGVVINPAYVESENKLVFGIKYEKVYSAENGEEKREEFSIMAVAYGNLAAVYNKKINGQKVRVVGRLFSESSVIKIKIEHLDVIKRK